MAAIWLQSLEEHGVGQRFFRTNHPLIYHIPNLLILYLLHLLLIPRLRLILRHSNNIHHFPIFLHFSRRRLTFPPHADAVFGVFDAPLGLGGESGILHVLVEDEVADGALAGVHVRGEGGSGVARLHGTFVSFDKDRLHVRDFVHYLAILTFFVP